MDRYIVDTNILVQFATELNFTEDVRYLLYYSGAQIYISSASVQEFINLLHCEDVKLQKQKIVTVSNVFDFVENTLKFTVKYIDKGHLKQLCKMDIVEKHTDPFDRIIIAQAIVEKIPLISSDKKFPKYKKMGLDFISNY
jgi:PIN domain nuclease of toxin-antitoxin system